MITKIDDYNNVPVKYCKNCLDLKVLPLSSGKGVTKDIDYCGECGSADIEEAHIDEFLIKHKEFYGEDYITRRSKLENKK